MPAARRGDDGDRTQARSFLGSGKGWVFRATDVTKIYGEDVVANDGISLSVEPGRGVRAPRPERRRQVHVGQADHRPVGARFGSITLGSHDLVAIPASPGNSARTAQAQMPIDSFAAGGDRADGPDPWRDRPEVRRRAGELIEALDIQEWERSTGQQLSGGVKRLVGFAMVACIPGRVVILDEPTNDVDPLRSACSGTRSACWVIPASPSSSSPTTSWRPRSPSTASPSSIGEADRTGTPSSLKADDRARMRLQVMLVPGSDTPELPAFVRTTLASRTTCSPWWERRCLARDPVGAGPDGRGSPRSTRSARPASRTSTSASPGPVGGTLAASGGA